MQEMSDMTQTDGRMDNVQIFVSLRLLTSLCETIMSILGKTSSDPHVPFSNFSSGTDVSLCPDGYTRFEDKCFVRHLTKLNWTDAESVCNEMPGGHLASFNTLTQWNFVKNFV